MTPHVICANIHVILYFEHIYAHSKKEAGKCNICIPFGWHNYKLNTSKLAQE